MHTIQFWKSWTKPYLYFFWFLSALLILSIGFFWYSNIINPAPVISWEYFQELQTEQIPVRSFRVGLANIPVQADNFMVYETQLGSWLQPNLTASYLFLSSLLIATLVILTIITTLSRFWFIVGMGLFSLFVISLQTETTEVFGLTNKIPAAIILFSVVALAYYFHAFKTSTGYFVRLLAFSFLFLVVGVCLVFFGEAQDPLLQLSVNGYTMGLILSLVFILMVGPEIPAAFINVLTQGTRQTKTLRHFFIITGFYFLNLLMAYGIKTGYLDWNIWVIDLFFLFTVSAILGIWGFRQREPQYASILSADPLGIYFILSMALVSFATMGYLFATANDTAIIVIRDAIMYSHLGYGIIFLAYIISNFGSMLSKNLQVYKVLYKPATMPYFTFRMMGLITSLAFLVFDTSWRTPLNQIYAAYYNSYGDLYYAQGNDQLAEGFYNKSVFYRNQNHHAHYALASIQAERLEPQKVKYELTEASSGNPTEFSFINLSDAYQLSGNLLESVMVLNEAKNKFPKSGIIYNALGLTFSKLKMSDSSLLSFQEARKTKAIKEIAETNLLATSARFKLTYPADSLLHLIGSEKEGPQANALALANLQNLTIDLKINIDEDTLLSATKASFLCNYFINQPTKIDTSLLAKAIALAQRPSNDYFKEVIIVAASHAYYSQGYVKRAFELTREVAYQSGRGKYFTLLGTWALEQNNPQIAANYFEIAKDKNQPNSLLYEAIATTEADSISKAIVVWDSLSRGRDSTQVATAKRILKVLTSTSNQIIELTDEDKYEFCRYKVSFSDTTTFWRIVESMKSEELKARAILDLSKKWFAQDETMIASEIIQKLKGLKLTDKNIYDEILVFNMMFLAEMDKEKFLQQSLDKSLPVQNFANELMYLQALQDENSGREEEARIKFEHLSNANVHFAEGLVASSRFFSSDTTDRLKSYSILVTGLLARPTSIKLLKAYVKEAALIGFDDEASESLDKLKTLLPPRAFNRYVKENPDYFDIEQ
ncbi:MAG TPA: hypothetical protein PKJ83_12535 [Cyclobacteriaceae bacterium]|nr:hypothetical protein [Cyclobacteriaceae bacterium]